MILYSVRWFKDEGDGVYQMYSDDRHGDVDLLDALDVLNNGGGELTFKLPKALNGKGPLMFLGIAADVFSGQWGIEANPAVVADDGAVTVRAWNTTGTTQGANMLFWFAEVDKITQI